MDISFGEAIYPAPPRVAIPALLVNQALYPVLRIYPIETIIAEKYQTIVRLGMSNTRLKDHHDLYEISQTDLIAGEALKKAIQATFERRGTPVEAETPSGLSQQFYTDRTKLRDWKATLSLHNMPKSTKLEQACEAIVSMIMPVIYAIINDKEFNTVWDQHEWRSPST